MRSGLILSLVLLALTIAAGLYTSTLVKAEADRYTSAAEELLILTEQADWPRAAEVAESYYTTWQDAVHWLQTLINHEDTDNVTVALLQLKAGIRAQDPSACYEACAMLREHARHLYHRDAFTLGNVL